MLCWAICSPGSGYVGQLGALLAASESYVEPFGSRVGTMLGSLGLSWWHLKAISGDLEAVLGRCWAAWGFVGGF